MTSPSRRDGPAEIRAYIADGNYADALRQFVRYSSLAEDELGITPSPMMQSLRTTVSSLKSGKHGAAN